MSSRPSLSSRTGWLRKVLAPVSAVVVVVGVVFGLSSLKGRSDDPPPVRAPIINVTVLELQPIEHLEDTLTLKGSVEPWATIQLSAETAGRIARITAHEGDLIGRGQPVVYLEDDLLTAAFAEAKAKADFDAREAERMVEAQGRQVATEMEADLARSAAAGSKAAMDHAAAELERVVIHAPQTVHDATNGTDYVGRLNDLTVEIGEYVQAGHLVAEIVDISVVKVVVDVPELDIRYLQVGQTVAVTIRALGDRKVVGTIHFIEMVADVRTRTFRVEVKVANAAADLRPGMVVSAKLLRRVLNNVIMIPLDAVIPLENDYEVFISRDGTAHRRTVSLKGSLIQGQSVEARPPDEGLGLAAGDRLIIAGHRELGDGQRIVERPAASAMLAAETRAAEATAGEAHAAQ